jgi:lipoprotein signal peptidase
MDSATAPAGTSVPVDPTAKTGRRLALIAGLGVVVNLTVSIVVRSTLSVSHRGAAWLLPHLILLGHTEHVVPRISGVIFMAVAAVVLLTRLPPTLRRIPLMAPAIVLVTAGAVSNAIEGLTRGAATDYLGFRHIPILASGGVDNLADLEVYAAGLLGAVGLVFFTIRNWDEVVHGDSRPSRAAE